MQRMGSKYGQKKIKIVEALSAKIGVSPDLDGRAANSEIIAQLKEKFKAIAHRSEQIQILTVLPNSWSLCKNLGFPTIWPGVLKNLLKKKAIFQYPIQNMPGAFLQPPRTLLKLSTIVMT